jgi:hypothetical protein
MEFSCPIARFAHPSPRRHARSGRGTTRLARFLPRTLLLAVAVLVAGCASSRQAAYEQRLTAVVAPGVVADDPIAEAFGLDEHTLRVAGLPRGAATGN